MKTLKIPNAKEFGYVAIVYLFKEAFDSFLEQISVPQEDEFKLYFAKALGKGQCFKTLNPTGPSNEEIERRNEQLKEYYINTVVPHKVAVFEAGMELKKAFGLKNFHDIYHQLVFHDLSKFSIAEEAYAFHNFKDKDANSKEQKEAFQYAWHHHKVNNPHHPEYWMNVGRDGKAVPLPMPRHFVAEMVADWVGAGKTYGNPIEKWLKGNLHTFHFHDHTIQLLRNLLAGHLDVNTDIISPTQIMMY